MWAQCRRGSGGGLRAQGLAGSQTVQFGMWDDCGRVHSYGTCIPCCIAYWQYWHAGNVCNDASAAIETVKPEVTHRRKGGRKSYVKQTRLSILILRTADPVHPSPRPSHFQSLHPCLYFCITGPSFWTYSPFPKPRALNPKP